MSNYYLKVYSDRSELNYDKKSEIFLEGPSSVDARLRYRDIESGLKDGFLEKQIVLCRDNPSGIDYSGLINQHTYLFERLVGSITSEVGRALVGLTVLQLTIK